MNWGILAQVEIGRPYDHFASEMLAEILVQSDPLGLMLLRAHWSNIERLSTVTLAQRASQ
jgi:hypothetical protein